MADNIDIDDIIAEHERSIAQSDEMTDASDETAGLDGLSDMIDEADGVMDSAETEQGPDPADNQAQEPIAEAPQQGGSLDDMLADLADELGAIEDDTPIEAAVSDAVGNDDIEALMQEAGAQATAEVQPDSSEAEPTVVNNDDLDGMLADLESELAEEVPEQLADQPAESTETVTEEPADDLDDMLAGLESELEEQETETISEQPAASTDLESEVSGDDLDSMLADLESELTPEAAEPVSEPVPEQVVDSTEPQAEESVDDLDNILASLENEVLASEETEQPADEQIQQLDQLTGETEQLAEQADAAAGFVADASADITDEIQTPKGEVDDLLSQAASDAGDIAQQQEQVIIPEFSGPEEGEVIADQQIEQGHAVTDEPAIQAEVETEIKDEIQPEIEDSLAVGEDEQLVMDELDAVASGATQMEVESQGQAVQDSPTPEFQRFSMPQRILINTLEAANKPFESVPDSIKDTAGIIGIVTVIIAIMAAAAILILKG
ncbi:MAG: hypothetical protein JEZ07_06720 [Phycisphaerae bacterium]|nr:hypothetical protein [Phycisphaerae bacterium]